MCSPTSSKDSRLVRIVVPCTQTRLPEPRGHRDAGISTGLLGRPPTEPRAKQEAMSALCHSLVVDLTFCSSGVRTSNLHGEFEQLLLACSEGWGLHHAFICMCALY